MPTIFRDKVTLNGVEWNGSEYAGARMICDILDGWYDTSEVDVLVSPAGSRRGGVAASQFPYREKNLMLGGAVLATDRLSAERARIAIMRAMPNDKEMELTREDPLGSWSMNVRISGSITFEQPVDEGYRILVPLLAEDPIKYGPVFNREVPAYAGGDYYRTYASESTTTEGTTTPGEEGTPGALYGTAVYGASAYGDADGSGGTGGTTTPGTTTPGTTTTDYHRSYVDEGDDKNFREYQEVYGGVFNERIFFDNTGDSDTFPLMVVKGPLEKGWYLYNQTTDSRLSFDVTIPAGQSLEIDSREEVADLNGVGVEQALRGEWFGLPPGLNVVQLISPVFNSRARLNFTARPARR